MPTGLKPNSRSHCRRHRGWSEARDRLSILLLGRPGPVTMPFVTLREEPTIQVRRTDGRHAPIGGGASPEQGDRCCEACELEAALLGIGGSGEMWQDALRWIDPRRETRTPSS